MNRIDPLRLASTVLVVLGLAVLLAAIGDAGLRFPHPLHHEMDLECAVCHEGAEESESREDHLLPGSSACLTCHEEKDLTIFGWSETKRRRSGFPKFSHRGHLALDGLDCAHCHGALLDPLLAGTVNGEPGHNLCFECHDGKKAVNDCESCHADVQRLRPLDHQVEYRHSHQFTARGSAGACEVCHRDSESCSECHQGENVLFLTHDRNYLFTHAQDARKHEVDCTSCHDTRSFCNDCHQAEGIPPSSHRSNWAVGTNQHAVEARRDIGYCASCHEGEIGERCSGCHRDSPGPRGADRNIHPSSFNDYDVKGPWHDDEMYYCFDCHTKSSEPDGFCGYCHSPR